MPTTRKTETEKCVEQVTKRITTPGPRRNRGRHEKSKIFEVYPVSRLRQKLHGCKIFRGL